MIRKTLMILAAILRKLYRTNIGSRSSTSRLDLFRSFALLKPHSFALTGRSHLMGSTGRREPEIVPSEGILVGFRSEEDANLWS